MSAIKETKEKARGGRDRDRSDRGDRDMDGGYDKDGDRRGGFNRKKVCRFCNDNEYIMEYKDVRMMQSFLTEHGKIVARRVSGTCAMHQRKLTSALKCARQLALVGYISNGN